MKRAIHSTLCFTCVLLLISNTTKAMINEEKLCDKIDQKTIFTPAHSQKQSIYQKQLQTQLFGAIQSGNDLVVKETLENAVDFSIDALHKGFALALVSGNKAIIHKFLAAHVIGYINNATVIKLAMQHMCHLTNLKAIINSLDFEQLIKLQVDADAIQRTDIVDYVHQCLLTTARS